MRELFRKYGSKQKTKLLLKSDIRRALQETNSMGQKLIITRQIKKFSTFYGNQRFISAFKRDKPVAPNLTYINPVHIFICYFFKINLNIILPSMHVFQVA
jgi:hypothetical protein